MSRELAMIGTVLVTGVVMAAQQAPTPDAVPLLNTPAWQGAAPKYGEQLLLRRDRESGNSSARDPRAIRTSVFMMSVCARSVLNGA